MERDRVAAAHATSRPALPLLTTLRFFAAAEVVAFHAAQTDPAWARPVDFLSGLVSGGDAAVAFFFVLSGFILAYAHAGKGERDGCNVGAISFWRMRFARIAPAYYLALLIALPIAIQTIADAGALSWSLIVGFSSVLLFLQVWWSPYAMLWNYPAWSLSVECLFYALFPWLMRASARWSVGVLLSTTYALIVLVAICRETQPDPLQFWAFFPLLHLPLFVFGIALGRLYLFGPQISSSLHAAMLGVGVSVLLLIFGCAWLLPGWVRSDPVVVLTFALIIFGGAGAAAYAPLLALPGFILLGEASYSIYILHIPLRTWWEALVNGAMGTNLPGWLNFALYFGFVVVVSVWVYRHVETPLRRRMAGHRTTDAMRGADGATAWLKA
jgi:peptidoglycan/LPS O-acetylase OafA/YrhL